MVEFGKIEQFDFLWISLNIYINVLIPFNRDRYMLVYRILRCSRFSFSEKRLYDVEFVEPTLSSIDMGCWFTVFFGSFESFVFRVKEYNLLSKWSSPMCIESYIFWGEPEAKQALSGETLVSHPRHDQGPCFEAFALYAPSGI